MSRYLVTRILVAVPTLIGVTLVIFFMVRLIPGDPARAMLGEYATDEQVAAYRAQTGLDDPIIVQYLRFARGAVTGDFGRSIYTNRPVSEDLAARVPATLQLAAVALVFAAVIGCIGGIIAATHRHHPIGLVSSLVTMVGISIPSFWLALLLIIVFAVQLRWLPATGRLGLSSVVLPAISLGLGIAAIVSRMMRSSLLEILSQDYVRTARAKGLRESAVLVRHTLKGALLPTITVLGLEAGALIGGAVVTETIFSWPGLGQYLVNAVTYRDYPAIQGAVFIAAVGFIAVNIVVDLLYGALDPRIAR